MIVGFGKYYYKTTSLCIDSKYKPENFLFNFDGKQIIKALFQYSKNYKAIKSVYQQ
jgi:hypothetical protein